MALTYTLLSLPILFLVIPLSTATPIPPVTSSTLVARQLRRIEPAGWANGIVRGVIGMSAFSDGLVSYQNPRKVQPKGSLLNTPNARHRSLPTSQAKARPRKIKPAKSNPSTKSRPKNPPRDTHHPTTPGKHPHNAKHPHKPNQPHNPKHPHKSKSRHQICGSGTRAESHFACRVPLSFVSPTSLALCLSSPTADCAPDAASHHRLDRSSGNGPIWVTWAGEVRNADASATPGG
ncbi:hypothetical protein DFP72DRAFT_900208 [Ephemerocybe angulata]|uniref:Uncharacterized protein n=1 Tax=Ephemerocybe angulata TaxID=980116 RepID=A0A8H6M481_9AGAR|nr:hypothetical protein DFP72DRAFT_900208 [Tulosesus angulatus]